jgi:hypothetical protein
MSKKRPEYIFFVRCENYVRLCKSVSPYFLLEEMQPHCPLEMNIIRIMPGNLRAVMEIEKLFSGYRHSGRWFHYTGKLKLWLETPIAGEVKL